MTYLPISPSGTAANAGPLTDADQFSLSQAGVTRRTTLAALKAYVVAGSTGSTGISPTGSTGSSTGSTGGSTGSAGSTGTAGGTGELYTYPEGSSGPYGGIGDTGTGTGAQAYLYGKSLGELFGTYTYPNPGGTDGANNTTLKQAMTKLIADMGIKPKTMNAFINDAYQSISKVGNGTFAYGWNNDDSTISGLNGYLRPIIGLKMHGFNDTKGNRDTFVDIQNGVYDSTFLSEINTWIGFGYKHLVYRLAYEFDGTFMPDYFGSDAGTNADFAAAMRHLILLMKNRASQAGIKAEFTFNPSYINGIDTDVMNGWPGDDVIDIIDTDQYNSCYPRFKQGGFMNFNADGTPTGTYEQTQSTWILNANNRKKFWNYPGIKDNYPPDIYDYSYGGWSTLRAIQIAKDKGKPIAFSECGTGGGTNTDAYYPNDPTWVRWFWGMCQSAISQGVSIAHINIWNIYASDGQWWYSNVDYDPQPDVKAAYRKYFGDGYYPGGPTPVAGGGSSAGSTAGSTGSSGNTGTSSGPVTNQNGGILPTSGSGTPSVSGSTLASTTGSLVDAAGITWTLYAITGGFRPVLGGVGDARTDSNPIQSLLYYSGLMYACAADKVWYYFSFGNYTANPGDPRPAAATGPATAAVTGTNGNTVTFTLDGYNSFYDTGLGCNIYYYADGNGNPTLSSSAPGVVAAVVITENGNNVKVSDDLAGVTTYV